MLQTESSPLIKVAMDYVQEILRNQKKKIDKEEFQSLESLFVSYINGNRNPAIKDQIESILMKMFQDISPISRIERILQTCSDYDPTMKAFPREKRSTEYYRQKPKPWTNNEDIRLLAGIHLFHFNWKAVSAFVKSGRSGEQCFQRWARTLDPSISKEMWTDEEDERLIQLIHQFNNRWTKIGKELGRSDVQCRYRYSQIQKSDKYRNKYPELDLKVTSTNRMSKLSYKLDPHLKNSKDNEQIISHHMITIEPNFFRPSNQKNQTFILPQNISLSMPPQNPQYMLPAQNSTVQQLFVSQQPTPYLMPQNYAYPQLPYLIQQPIGIGYPYQNQALQNQNQTIQNQTLEDSQDSIISQNPGKSNDQYSFPHI